MLRRAAASVSSVAGQPNRPNLKQGFQRVGPSPLLHDSTITDSLDVHSAQRQQLVGRLDAAPLAPVRAPHREPRNDDVSFGHLTLYGDRQIGITVVEGQDVPPGSFNPNQVGVPFPKVAGQELRQPADIFVV